MNSKTTLFPLVVALIGLSGTAKAAESLCITSNSTPNAAISKWAGGATALSGGVGAYAGYMAATGPVTAGASLAPAAVLGVGAAAIGATAQAVDYVNNQFANNALGSPNPIKIPWEELGTHEIVLSLSDDYIGIRRLPASAGLPGIELPSGTSGKLVLEQKGTWWKAIVAFDKRNTSLWTEVACLQDSRKAMMIDLKPELADDNFVVLSKAKMLGVHTNMYAITNWNEASPKYNYVVHWYNSDEDPTSRDGVKIIKH